MKTLLTTLMAVLIISSAEVLGQGFCLTPPPKKLGIATMANEPCKIYWINVYVHRITNSSGNGYTGFINNVIITNLNNSLNAYGFYFRLTGSRDWIHNDFANPATTPLQLQGIVSDAGANPQSNAINIYVLPVNSQIQGGFVPDTNKKMLLIGGTRSVTHCAGGGTVNYEIAQSKVVSHEMGHSLGLVHTFQYSGDDGLSDTSIDYMQSNGCVNKSNCQFVSNCGSNCNVQTNPTSAMTNYMSYTVPTCMSVMTPMQVNLMRYSLNNSMAAVVHQSLTAPNLQNMTYDNNKPVATVNFTTSGSHNIYTNLDPVTLGPNVAWSGAIPYLSPFGTKHVNATISINAGQTVMVSVTATNLCGTSNRNPAFSAQSGWFISSGDKVKGTLSIVFETVQYKEALPQLISIYDQQTGIQEMSVNVAEAFDKQRFNKNTLEVNVAQLKPGVKIVKFFYPQIKVAENDKGLTKTERIVVRE